MSLRPSDRGAACCRVLILGAESAAAARVQELFARLPRSLFEVCLHPANRNLPDPADLESFHAAAVLLAPSEGFDCERIRRLQGASPRLAVVALCCCDDDEMCAEAVDSGAHSCLYLEDQSPRSLAGALQAAIRHRHLVRESEQSVRRLAAMFEQIDAGYLMLDSEWRVVRANPAVLPLLQLSREDLEDRVFWEVCPASAADELELALRDSQISGMRREVEAFLPSLSRRLLARICPDDAGIHLFLRDVTRQRLEEEIPRVIASGARCLLWYADIFDAGQDGLQWHLQMADEEAAMRVLPLDRRPGERYADAWYRARLKEDRRTSDAFGTENIRAGRSYAQEFRCRRADGAVRWLKEEVSLSSIAPGRWRAVGVCMDVTEHKQSESALRASEERSRALLASLPHRVFFKDREGRFVSVNEPFAEDLGLTPGDLEGKTDFDIAPLDRAERLRQQDLQVMRSRKSISLVDTVTHRNLERHVGVTKSPVVDDAGEVIGVLGLYTDITDRVEAEKELRATRNRLHYLLGSSPTVIYSCDPLNEYVPTFVSGNVVGLIGYTPAEMTQTPGFWRSRVHPDDLPDVLEVIRGADTRDGYTMEYRFRHKDGSWRWLQDSARLVRDESGRLVDLVGSWHDVTDRRTAADELRRVAAEYRRIVETAEEGIWVLDSELRTSFSNQRMATMLGCSPEEMLGRHPVEFTSPDSVAWLKSRLRRRRRGFSDRFDVKMKRKDGSDLWLFISAAPIVDERGIFQGSLGMVMDVTDRKRAEAELQTRNQQLEALSRRIVEVQEKERAFLARELHDEVGQLLTGLQLVLAMQKRRFPESEKLLAEADSLVQELMERVSQLSLDLRPTMLDDLGLEAALVWHFRRYTERSGIQVRFRRQGRLRRYSREVETAAYRVAQESLTNAARYAGVGEVFVDLCYDEECLRIQVRDVGRGFLPEAVLAERNSAGLAGMQERAALLGGSLCIESAPGKGTIILAELPNLEARGR